MKWIWDGGFRAHKMEADGTRIEKTFTSSAQARQFVEQKENLKLAKRITKPENRIEARKRKGGYSRPPAVLTAQQQKLKEEALKMVQGL